MRNLKLVIEYDGTRYRGWQLQPGHPTVQQMIEEALRAVTGEGARIAGAGRTDAGVHAAFQVANVRVASPMPCDRMRRALNALLPRDIVVKSVEEADESFHARYSASSKRYRYTILNRPAPSAFDRHYVVHMPRRLDVGAMAEAGRLLIGTHDFTSFACSSKKEGSRVRTVLDVTVEKRGDYVIIEVEAAGFLYKMVRSIVGSLIEVGRGRLAPADVAGILDARDRRRASATAPAKGLSLVRVAY